MTILTDTMRTMRLYVFGVLIVSLNQVYGQTIQSKILKRYNTYADENLAEYAYLAIDNAVFYSGSQLAFNVVLLDQFLKPSTVSQIINLELIHENNEYRRKYKYELENGLISSIIKLPFDIPTGNYQLVAYTNAMRNFDVNKLMDRRLLYIQNTLEPAQNIAIDYIRSTSNQQHPTLQETELTLNVEEEVDRILFTIETLDKSVDQELYLVGEGLQGIQFIQKFGPNQIISLPKQEMRGSFQRITVISDTNEVMASKSFLVNEGISALEPSYTLNHDSIKLFVLDNLITRVAINRPITHHETLFERICEIYFGTKATDFYDGNSNLKTFKELPSNGLTLWESILSVTDQKVNKFIPESSFQLRAELVGDLTVLDEATLSIHFFDENVEFSKPLDSSGKVIMDIDYPLSDDYTYTFIINGDGKDLSREFEIVFDSGPEIPYIPNSGYFEKDYSDSLLYEKYEHYYVLSTFANIEEPNNAFWTSLPIDATFKVEDYRDIADFGEFIKEAVHNVSVHNENNKRSLRILNPFKGYPTDPKLVILNDQVLKDHSILFDLPLASIESIHVIDSKENLLSIGTNFTAGVLIVTTVDLMTIPSDALDDNFTFIIGTYQNHKKNNIQARFGTTRLFSLSDQAFFSEILERNETKELQLFVETLKKDGTFSSFRTNIPK